MLVSDQNIEVPDDCGDFCPLFRAYGEKYPIQHQGDACCHCPIVNCKFEGPDGGVMVEPPDYRADLARTYTAWWAANPKEEKETQHE